MKMMFDREHRIGNRVTDFFLGKRPDRDLRGARREAVLRAYDHFVRRYPRWAHSLFDEYFVTHTAQDLLTHGLLRPSALAEAWTRQIYYRDVAQRQRHIGQILPVAEIFVRLVRAEMV